MVRCTMLGPALGMKICAGCTTPNFLYGMPNAEGPRRPLVKKKSHKSRKTIV